MCQSHAVKASLTERELSCAAFKHRAQIESCLEPDSRRCHEGAVAEASIIIFYHTTT